MSTEAKHHPQAYYATHDQLYSWYERLLEGAIQTAQTGAIGPIYQALEHINPNNWIETETGAYQYYVVQDGDTLAGIALRYDKSSPEDLKALAKLNHRILLNAPHQIMAGYHLLLPDGWKEVPPNVVYLNKSNFDD